MKRQLIHAGLITLALYAVALFLPWAISALASDRDTRWPAVRRAYLEDHPACEACGSRTDLDVHHVRPVHAWPDLELDAGNLIVLCNAHHCHLMIGHLGCYRSWNPLAREDAARQLERVRSRPTTRTEAGAFARRFSPVHPTTNTPAQ